MTTKPPPSVKPSTDAHLEKIAYASVENIPTVEPHDRDRLAYNVWRFLQFRRDPLEIAVRSAGARLLISEQEVIQKITQRLQQSGVQL